MSIKRNILANYVGQLYVTAAGIVMVPLYIKYMGAEAYGLVGVFATLQALFALLDAGLTPTVARESARFRGGVINSLDYRRLVRALEGVFIAVASLGGLMLLTLAHPIAEQWLKTSLDLQEVTLSLQLIALIVSLRWMCGLYRGIISGAERLVWLSGFSSLIATGRFVLILPVLIFVSSSPRAFFGFQLFMAVLELTGLAWMAYCLLPTILPGQRIHWQWAPLRPVLNFSLSIAFTSSVWVLVTQTDKLVLSKILSLADYAYFTVAVLGASGIMIVSGPISSALMPRMTRIQAEGQHDTLISLYRKATQLVTVTAIPVALVLIFFAPQVLWAWTGDSDLVQHASPVLSLYAAGYAFLVVGAFPYYLQYSKGNLRLHLIGNALFLLLLIPSVVWAATHYGMSGAGWAWLLANAVYFVLWTPLVHNKFAPGLHTSWLWKDIALPAALPLAAGALATQFIPWPEDRVAVTLALIGTWGTLLLLAFPLASRIHMSNGGARFENS